MKKKVKTLRAAACLRNLTDEQKAAVRHRRGPALVISCPGSGKTRSLTRRVAYLIAKGAAPSRILAVTFTNKAAGEMRKRIIDLVGSEKASKVWMSTFHSFCAKLLREDPRLFGVKRNFIICDEVDTKNYAEQAIATVAPAHKKHLATRGMPTPKYVKSAISKFKLKLLFPDEIEVDAGDAERIFLCACYSAYDKLLKKAGVLDFDDLLFYVTRKFADDHDVRDYYAERFDHILVDEYQDTNRAQFLLVKNLGRKAKSIFAIGDPNQHLYGFSGADVRNILEFPKEFKGTTTYNLSCNFRSVKAVTDVANSVIQHSKELPYVPITVVKEEGQKAECIAFETPQAEAGAVCDEIRTLVRRSKAKYSDFAILYRTRAQSAPFEAVFVQQNIPFKIVGSLGFYKRAIIKDVIAYMRLMLNSRDDASFTRIYNKPTRGIGRVTFTRLCEFRDEHDCSLLEVLRYRYYKDLLPSGACYALDQLRKIFVGLKKLPKDSAENAVTSIVKNTGLMLALEKSNREDDRRKAEDLASLFEAAMHYDSTEHGGVHGFLQWVSLMQETDDSDEVKNRVLLMTCHASKGLEFNRVYLVGCSDKKMPIPIYTNNDGSRMTQQERDTLLEEERRIFFVAVTRAESHLTITYPISMYDGECGPSKFIEEAGATLMRHDLSESEVGSFSGSEAFKAREVPNESNGGESKDLEPATCEPNIQGQAGEDEGHKGKRQPYQFSLWS